MTAGPLCLVTGASGFIGGHVVERLVGEGYRVRGLVRATSDRSVIDALGVEVVVGDLTRADSLASAVQGCDCVVHCAALVSDWATVEEIERVNVAGTRAVLRAAVAAAVRRFVFISSTDVYGHPGAAAIDETHVPAGFSNWYAQTKRAAEEEVGHVHRRNELEVVVLRPATVYGPRSTEVVGEIAKAIRGGHMILIGRGRANMGLIYVGNLVDLIVLALQADAAPGEVLNATDGLGVTWRQFADDLAAGLGARRVRWSLPYGVALGLGVALESVYRPLRRATGLTLPALLSRQAVHVMGVDQDFSNRRAREVLGWEPAVDYQRGLERTLEWLRGGKAG